MAPLCSIKAPNDETKGKLIRTVNIWGLLNQLRFQAMKNKMWDYYLDTLDSIAFVEKIRRKKEKYNKDDGQKFEDKVQQELNAEHQLGMRLSSLMIGKVQHILMNAHQDT